MKNNAPFVTSHQYFEAMKNGAVVIEEESFDFESLKGIVKSDIVTHKLGILDPATGMHDINNVVSTSAVDRDRDVIHQSGWDLSHYNKNPVVLWAHSHYQPPVARSLETKANDQEQLASIDRFTPKDMSEFGYMIYQMVVGKFLNAKSVGFRPLEWTVDEERRGYELLSNELLEHSWVPVPSNPEALVQAGHAGIDLSPMREWASKFLDSNLGERRVLLWLPKHVVESIWKQTGFVDGWRKYIVTASEQKDAKATGKGADAVTATKVPDPLPGQSDKATDRKHQPEVDEMDFEKFLESMGLLTDAIKEQNTKLGELVELQRAKAEVDDKVDLSAVVSGAFKDAVTTGSGKLAEGED